MEIVIGAGGGYDIVAAAMIRARNQRIASHEIDVGGLLNPKFVHIYRQGNSFQAERAVNLVTDARKYRKKGAPLVQIPECHTTAASVYFVDHELSKLLDCSVYNFSPLFSAYKIALFLSERYDTILLCDVGGDILFFGEQDNSVSTPVMDAFSLTVAFEFQKITGKPVTLCVLGLGLDGEMRRENMERNLGLLKKEGSLLGVSQLEQEDITVLQTLYQAVKHEGKGRTNQLLIDIWHGLDLSRNALAKERNVLHYSQWFNQIIYLDAAGVYRHNPLCAYKTIHEMTAHALKLGVVLR